MVAGFFGLIERVDKTLFLCYIYLSKIKNRTSQAPVDSGERHTT